MKNSNMYLGRRWYGISRKWFENDSVVTQERLGSVVSRFSLASLICLCMLTIGVGNAWGATATNNCGANIATSYSDMESGKAIEWKAADATSYTSPIRVYSGNIVTFHCKAGASRITKIEITASSDAYATAAKNSTWEASGTGVCSASASASGTAVTVTVTGTASTVTCTTTAQTRWSRVIVTYDVAASEAYTVSFNTGTGNPAQGDLEEDSPGAGIELPNIIPSCSGDGWELYGWAESSCASSTTTAPTIVGQAGDPYVPESDITLYAVYRQLVSESTTTTYTLNGNWTSTAGNWTKVDGNNLNGSLATGKWGLNSGSSTATSPISYSDISNITFTGSKSGSGSGTVEFLYGSGTTWTSLGSKAVANSQTWSISPTQNGQLKIIFTRTAGNVYIASIAITYKIYNYYSNPSCAACEADPTIGTAQLKGSFSLSNFLCSRRF